MSTWRVCTCIKWIWLEQNGSCICRADFSENYLIRLVALVELTRFHKEAWEVMVLLSWWSQPGSHQKTGPASCKNNWISCKKLVAKTSWSGHKWFSLGRLEQSTRDTFPLLPLISPKPSRVMSRMISIWTCKVLMEWLRAFCLICFSHFTPNKR